MDYESLGLKVGIEIHQRLDTDKLFCNCSSSSSSEPLDETVHRRLRAVAGELGTVDPAALYEYTRGRDFDYLVYPDATCLVELDEEPPHPLNGQALEISLSICKALDCEIPDEIHVMRKTVVDGSNTAGFQRTAIVGMDGVLKTSFGEMEIENVALEEESAQIVEEGEGYVRYGLDRLGIPLIEIGTGPDANSPEEAAEMAESLGNLLRGTGKVQRGLGTIRQDVNVSVSGGARVEIKGFQELEHMEELIEREAERQVSLIDMARELDDVGTKGPEEVTELFSNVRNDMIQESLESGEEVYAFVLKDIGGLLAEEISGEMTLGKELSGYAVGHGAGGIIHSDEDVGDYNLGRELSRLKDELGAGKKDVIGIVVGEANTAQQAAEAVIERVEKLPEGVLEETRFPNPDATTSYARPLPGGARMYPETDVPAIEVDDGILDEIETPRSREEMREGLIEKGVPEGRVDELLDSGRLSVFESAVDEGAEPKKAAELLTATLTSLRREGIEVGGIDDEALVKLLSDLGDIPNEAVPEILEEMAGGKSYEEASDIDTLSREELGEIIDDVIEENRETIESQGMGAFKKLMGPVMGQVRGRIEGEVVAEELKERIQEELD